MINFIKRKIVLCKFEREAIECLKGLREMSIHDFEAEINNLIKEINIRLGALMTMVVSKENPMVCYPDNEASDADKIVFYDLFNEKKRFMLANGEVTDLSNRTFLNVNVINEAQKEEIAKLEAFYQKAYELFGSTRSIQFSSELFFNYSLTSGCYYALKDRFGNISEIREVDEFDEKKPDTNNKFYISRGIPFATVDYRHLDELHRIKDELDEFWKSLSPNSQENDNEEAVGSTHEVKTINLR